MTTASCKLCCVEIGVRNVQTPVPSVRRAMFIDAEPGRDPPSVRRAMFL